MSTVCLNDLKAISWVRKATVSGYIHTLESKHSQQIPKQIILLCMLFYGNDCDEWNVSFIGNGLELKDRTLSPIAISRMKKAGSAYGKRIIKSGRFSWRFRIESMDMIGRGNKPMIGIWRVNFIDNPPLNTFFTVRKSGYAIDPTTGLITDKYGCFGNPYAEGCNEGSIIEMVLDLESLGLRYIIDGKDYGKAFDVVKSDYRMAVYLSVGASVTLLQ